MATVDKDFLVKQGITLATDKSINLSNTYSHGTGGITWNTISSNFGTTEIRSVYYNNSLWVVSGATGQLRTSTDTITWTTRTSNFGNTAILSVAYGDSLWVAGGSSGQLRTSTDTITWTTRTSNFGTTEIRSVLYNNNIWVAIGLSGQIRTSTDTIAWTTVTSNFGNTSIFSIDYGNSLWVAGGSSGQLRTSTDATTWTTVTSNFGTSIIYSITYGNNLWVAGGSAGQIRTSTDAITWTTQTSNFGTTDVRSIAYGNSLWVAGGATGQLRTSTDTITWTTRTSNFGTTIIYSIAYGNNIWLAGGFSGQLRKSPNGIFTYLESIKSSNSITNTSFLLPQTGETLDNLVSDSSFSTLTNKTIDGANNTLTVRIANDVSGLGTGIATFLGTPSSANLISAVTDETGTGSLVFGTSPTITTPTLTLSSTSSTTSGRVSFDATNDKIIVGDGTNAVEFAPSTLLTNSQSTAYTLVLSDKDKMVELDSSSPITLSVPTNASVAFPVGSQINILQTGTGQVTVAASTPATTTVNGTPSLILRAQWSAATLIKRATDSWVLIGDLST